VIIALETAQLKVEAVKLGLLFVAALAAFQIAFFKESPLVVLRIVAAMFFLFVLPGWCVLYIWREKIGFLERAVAGAILFAGITAILAYFSGFIGIHVKYAVWIVPLFGYVAFIIQLFSPSIHGKNRKH